MDGRTARRLAAPGVNANQASSLVGRSETQTTASRQSIRESRSPGPGAVHDQRDHHPSRRISVTRLPVDLLPDVTYPTVSVIVRYPGVGPQEIEQLITRPIEQTVSAVAGLDQLNSTSSEGSSRVSLSFAWGTDLNEAMDDMRMRLDRVRGRMPIDAEPLRSSGRTRTQCRS